MDDVVTLLEIESIKQLKARYCRYLDTKDWENRRTIFTDDFVSDAAESGGLLIEGADAFLAYIGKTLGKPSQPTVHQVHAPEIEFTETYQKTAGQWRIKTSKLTRLREDIFNPFVSFRISERVREAGAKAARRLGK